MSGLIIDAITHGVRAGALRRTVRQHGETAPNMGGLLQLADRHTRAAASLLNAICSNAGKLDQ